MSDDNIVDFDAVVKSKLKNFSNLLEEIETLSDKKKQLWIEIYENAVSDRQNAYAMFRTLVKIADDKTNEHAVHGRTMATYIEKMSKANDQLIKLAELIADAEKAQESLDSEDMFNQIKMAK